MGLGAADVREVAWSCGAGAVDDLAGPGPVIGSGQTRARHRAAESGGVAEVMDTLPIVADPPAYGRHAAREASVPRPAIGPDGPIGSGALGGVADGGVGRRRRGWRFSPRAARRVGRWRPADPRPVPLVLDEDRRGSASRTGARPSAVDAAAVPIVLTATIASPTLDLEAARAKLWVRLREQLAVSSPAVVMDGPDEGALVVTGPRESSDPYGRVWFWFRGTVQLSRPPVAGDDGARVPSASVDPVTDADAVVEPEPWPLRPAPRRFGSGWACHLTSPAHASRVRRGLRTRLQEGARTGDCTRDAGDDLMLAFEELTSNAFRHGAGAVDVTIADTAAGWLVVVEDEAPDRPPRPFVGRNCVLGGMGLGMVAGLALDVGWQPHAGRKSVWAELPSHR